MRIRKKHIDDFRFREREMSIEEEKQLEQWKPTNIK